MKEFPQILKDELTLFYEYLKKEPSSCSMAAKELGIYQKNLTRYKRTLEKANRLWITYRGRCKITGRIVQFLSTDEYKKPNDNQLKLFT